jgi:hypothetical protein
MVTSASRMETMRVEHQTTLGCVSPLTTGIPILIVLTPPSGSDTLS